MEIRELQACVLLADQLHFGRTADLLHISQPALTKQIHRLEEQLGLILFERSPTRLTAAGELFVAQARTLTDGHERLARYARTLARGEAGRLRIGFGYHTLELVPRAVVQLRESFPELEVTLRDLTTVEQLAALRERTLDVGFVRLPVPAGFASRPVLEEELILLSSEPVRSLRACAGLPFVLLSRSRSPSLLAQCVRKCAQAGFAPRIVQEASDLTTVMALVRAGMGVSVLPRSVVAAGFPGLYIRSLRERWTVGAAWRSDDDSPVLRHFLALL